jgi:hypothetical protein
MSPNMSETASEEPLTIDDDELDQFTRLMTAIDLLRKESYAPIDTSHCGNSTHIGFRIECKHEGSPHTVVAHEDGAYNVHLQADIDDSVTTVEEPTFEAAIDRVLSFFAAELEAR